MLSVLGLVINQAMLCYDFTKRVLDLRVGKIPWDLKPEAINLGSTAMFIGGHASFSIISMLVTFAILSIGLFPIFYKYTWILLWNKRKYIIL
jgi:hypothetical protein